MRNNMMGEIFLSPEDDILEFLGCDVEDVYAIVEADPDEGKWTAEILENLSGERDLAIEGYDSMEALVDDLASVGITQVEVLA